MRPRPGKPVILAVCDRPEDLRAISRELRSRYAEDYRVACEESPERALGSLEDLKAAGTRVALVLADQRLGGTDGVGFLTRVKGSHPTAPRLLLTAPTERSTGAVLPRAMALGRIDHFEPKPGAPPNDGFHRAVTDLLEEWSWPHRSETDPAVRIVGERWSPRSHELRDIFERYLVPSAFYPADSKEGAEVLDGMDRTAVRWPVLAMPDGRLLEDTSNEEVADAYAGALPKGQSFGLVVVGGGPAGLAAAVYGASEGLSTLVLRDASTGRTETVPAAALFVLIGAQPRTGWMPGEIERGEGGFVATGQDLTRGGNRRRTVAAAPFAAAGNQHARRFRRGGREVCFGEAGGLGRRGGVRRHPTSTRVPEPDLTPGGETRAVEEKREPGTDFRGFPVRATPGTPP